VQRKSPSPAPEGDVSISGEKKKRPKSPHSLQDEKKNEKPQGGRGGVDTSRRRRTKGITTADDHRGGAHALVKKVGFQLPNNLKYGRTPLNEKVAPKIFERSAEEDFKETRLTLTSLEILGREEKKVWKGRSNQDVQEIWVSGQLFKEGIFSFVQTQGEGGQITNPA